MLVPAEVWSVAKAEEQSAVLIRPVGSEVAVPIWIDQLAAHSIMVGMTNQPFPRPLTHDLLLSVIKKTRTSINRVEITDLKSGTFYARLILNGSGKNIGIDARPSDCIALAVRIKCPIYIDEAVVDEAGMSVNIITSQSEAAKSPREEKLKQLKAKLNEVVEEENYEEAAKLRDQINDLEKNA